MRIKTNRYLFLVALIAATILVIGLTETKVIGQAPSSRSVIASTPKTPWGRPDLQGTWSNTGVVVPFQRAKEFGDRQFMTEAEHKKALDELMARNARPGRDNREGRGTEKDVARAYNDLFSGDKPTEVSYRTSQIIDPPDGRVQTIGAA